ncbi:unnamed protein product [Didymodactylos carnosus]|uniref:Uncharacterized protein n=1 Tax=Didymodactylos carnosus TaxID=1234261 RepID=A0A814JMB6_9BILA|nr:unnamed protein product [Didymodactylos carnosus]CAF3810240.1 unnamed protein product [Didymodactylos carnosus]
MIGRNSRGLRDSPSPGPVGLFTEPGPGPRGLRDGPSPAGLPQSCGIAPVRLGLTCRAPIECLVLDYALFSERDSDRKFLARSDDEAFRTKFGSAQPNVKFI